MRGLVVGMAVVMLGCGSHVPLPGASDDPKQQWAAAEVARLAGLLGVKAEAVFTDEKHTYGCERYGPECYDAAWWNAGQVAFYTVWLDTADLALITDVASHEVAHAFSMNHDVRHWCMSTRYARPTYPWPGPGGPACEGVK